MKPKVEEQRVELRIRLEKQPDGKLFLHVRDQCLPVISIRDVSQTGMSLLLDRDVGDAVNVTLEYRHRDIDVKVTGTIIWDRPANADESPAVTANGKAHVLGVSLVSPHLLLTFMEVGL
jgi:hypothetical protein